MPVDPIAISRSALDVEWQRVSIAAQNLANENTTGIGGKGGYRPLTLISGPQEGFGTALAQGSRAPVPGGVKVVAIEARANAVRRVYDPNHPAADAAGVCRLSEHRSRRGNGRLDAGCTGIRE